MTAARRGGHTATNSHPAFYFLGYDDDANIRRVTDSGALPILSTGICAWGNSYRIYATGYAYYGEIRAFRPSSFSRLRWESQPTQRSSAGSPGFWFTRFREPLTISDSSWSKFLPRAGTAGP